MKINNYNETLLNKNANVVIKEYIKYVAINIYNYEVSFMENLLDLLIRKEIHIHHDKLVEFGILSVDEKTNQVKSNNVKHIIEQNSFTEGIDFSVQNINQPVSSRGGSNKLNYYFHPDAFGVILMRSKKTKKYTKYYNLCQTCIYYHSEYQLKMKQTEVSRMIDEQKETNKKLEASEKRTIRLELKLDKSNEKLDKSNEKLDKISEENAQLKQQLNNLQLTNNELVEKVDNLNDKVDFATETRVVQTDNPNNDGLLILFKHDNCDKYYISRANKQNSPSAIKRLEEQDYSEVFRISNVPNAVNIYQHFKDNHKKDFKFESSNKFYFKRRRSNNTLTIIELIKEIYGWRKEV